MTNPTIDPSALFAGWLDAPAPARPSGPAETRLVFMPSWGGRRCLYFRPYCLVITRW